MSGATTTRDKKAKRQPEPRNAPTPAPGTVPARGKRRKKQPRSAPPPEVELDAETLEFIAAIERYRKVQSRPFPSWSEVLHVLRQLGYRKS